MDIRSLKEYILDNDLIEEILEAIGCHHIVDRSEFIQCANKDGNNSHAVYVYRNDYLTTIDYTREISGGNRTSDIIDLVGYNMELNFPESMKFISDTLGISYYHEFLDDVPESLVITRQILDMNSGSTEEREEEIKPINPVILTYYRNFVNDLFYDDGIDYLTQQEFGIGYDERSNRITIPIYSEIGDLVGVKGRLFKKNPDEGELKYIYLEPTPRYAILFGLDKTYDYIKQSGFVYVFESEKAVMQLWSNGYFNSVATGGKRITQRQITLLTRLEADIVICFDNDVTIDEINDIADRFQEGIPIYYMKDNMNLLGEKESPSDDIQKFNILKEKCVFRV